ncbi:1-aminocyclopropane-1-carboxylate oxidase [Citrus sinensis]|nr:1-aminocyclopropane-1-carboxylate oxidase [Citrus sinensis]
MVGFIFVDARFWLSSFYDQGLCSINFTTTRISPRKASSPEVPAHTDRSEYAGCFLGANSPTLKSDMKVQGTFATNLMAVRLPLSPDLPQFTPVILPTFRCGFPISVVVGGCVAFEIGLAADVLVDEQGISAPAPQDTRLLRDTPVRRTLPSDICSSCLVSSEYFPQTILIMVVCNDGLKYDKAKEVKEFDDTKAGVKGLVDSGVTKIPRFFIHPLENLPKSSDNDDICLQVPLIDLEGFEDCRRMEIVNKIREASETWGFFQLINHGVPVSVMDEMLEGVRRFHEQPKEVKMEMYSRDCQKLVRFFSNGDLLVTKGAADWRDAIAFDFRDGQLDPETFPKICRKAVSEYMKYIIKLKTILSALLSEALGLSSDYLASMESMETESLVCQFYPPCPEPELTFGASKHSDPSFLTVLLQDHIGGLQVLHRNYWADVPFVQGALVINIGDFIQASYLIWKIHSVGYIY